MADDQLTADDLTRLFRERRYTEIEDARNAGRLNVLMGADPPPDPDKQLSAADVSRLFRNRQYDVIEAARQRGSLSDLLDHPTTGDDSAA